MASGFAVSAAAGRAAERGFPPEAVGVAVLGLHNVVVHRLLPAPADAALNLTAAAGLTAFAARAGCSRGDLGIDVADASSGLRVGLGAATAAAGMVTVAAVVPASRRLFHDRRVRDVGRGEAVYHLAVRIPLATALAEEVLFRGALLALFRQRRSEAAAVLWSSLLFGAWHVLPTIDHYQGNPVSELVADPSRGRRLAVLATALSTAGAGVVFARLRLRSGSVLAPVLAHAAVNVSAWLAGAARGHPPPSRRLKAGNDGPLAHRARVMTAARRHGRLRAGRLRRGGW